MQDAKQLYRSERVERNLLADISTVSRIEDRTHCIARRLRTWVRYIHVERQDRLDHVTRI